MRGIEPDDSEMAFRRGYQAGAVETFHAVEQFLDPATREGLQNWIEKDVSAWRMKAMLGYPPIWRLRMLGGGFSLVPAWGTRGLPRVDQSAD